MPVRSSFLIRIQRPDGQKRIVKVKSPLQKSPGFYVVKLHAEDFRSLKRHMKITVREIIFVHAYAVINHSVRAGKLIELRAVHAYDRQSHRFFLREFVM